MNKKKTILIVDDDSNIRLDLKILLEFNDFQIQEACDGHEGLNLALEIKPSLIISDIAMPVMDGFTFLEKVQNEESIKNIPFLFLTAKGEYNDLRRGMDLGADDYIYKPYNIKELLNAINTRLKKSISQEETYKNKFEEVRQNIRKSIPHELWTPLTVIMNNTELLLSRDLDKEVKESVLTIEKQSNRLRKIFENYIFLTKLEIAKEDDIKIFKTSKTYIPSSIIKNICLRVFENSNQEYHLFINDDLDEIPINDEHYIKIVYELLSNALKFSEDNTTIKVSSLIKDNKYHFSVENIGPRFTQDQIDMIGSYVQFDRDKFEQQGLGLGLSIIYKLMNIYQGEVFINSDSGKTTVGFSLTN